MNPHSPARRIAGNTGFMGIAGVAGKAIHFALLVYLGNELTRSGFGFLGFCLTAAIVFGVLADFGLEQYATLVIARNKARLALFMRRFLRLRLIVIGMSAVIMTVFLVVYVSLGRTSTLSFLSIGYMIALSVVGLVRVFFRGLERMEFEALLGFLEKVLMVALSLFHLKVAPWPVAIGASPESRDVINVLLAFIEADLLVFVLGMIMAARLSRSTAARLEAPGGASPREASDFRSFLIEVWPYALGAVCVTIFYRADTLILQAMSGEEVVGDYRYAFILFETLFLFPQTVALAAYPAISAMTGSGTPTTSILGGLARIFILVSLPLAVGGLLVGEELVTLIFPQGVQAHQIWWLLIWALPFVYGNFLLGTALTASGHQKANLSASAAMAAANLVLNVLLIPRWGASGAAVAAGVTQVLYSLLLWAGCRRNGLRIPFMGALSRTAAATVLMGGVLLVARGLPLAAAIGLGILVFAAGVFLFGALSIKDLRSFGDCFRPVYSASITERDANRLDNETGLLP